MSFDHVRQIVETEFYQNWLSIPIAYDNVMFDSEAQSEWIRVTVIEGDALAPEIGGVGGGCPIRRVGEVAVQIFARQWEGSQPARLYADDVDAMFTHRIIDGVLFRQARIVRVGYANDWYQLNVYVPFQYDDPAG